MFWQKSHRLEWYLIIWHYLNLYVYCISFIAKHFLIWKLEIESMCLQERNLKCCRYRATDDGSHTGAERWKSNIIIGMWQFKIYLWMQWIITGYQTGCILYEIKSEIKIRTMLIGWDYMYRHKKPKHTKQTTKNRTKNKKKTQNENIKTRNRKTKEYNNDIRLFYNPPFWWIYGHSTREVSKSSCKTRSSHAELIVLIRWRIII